MNKRTCELCQYCWLEVSQSAEPLALAWCSNSKSPFMRYAHIPNDSPNSQQHLEQFIVLSHTCDHFVRKGAKAAFRMRLAMFVLAGLKSFRKFLANLHLGWVEIIANLDRAWAEIWSNE